MKYDAVVQCGENGNIEILVFNPPAEPEVTPLPVEFPTCMDETDIRALLERNDRALKALGIEPGC